MLHNTWATVFIYNTTQQWWLIDGKHLFDLYLRYHVLNNSVCFCCRSFLPLSKNWYLLMCMLLNLKNAKKERPINYHNKENPLASAVVQNKTNMCVTWLVFMWYWYKSLVLINFIWCWYLCWLLPVFPCYETIFNVIIYRLRKLEQRYIILNEI
jgi:hypothetical protein